MRIRHTLAAIAALLGISSVPRAEEPRPFKVLIVDGQNNHNWKVTTPLLERILKDSQRFEVDIATSPPAGQDMQAFQPPFSQYRAILSNYNGEPWSPEARAALVDYVRSGGGFVAVHAANNAFPDWPEYNEMIGLGWRGADFGDRLIYSADDQLLRMPKGEGPGAGHGPQYPFPVVMRHRDHPISKGLPQVWMHAQDELYHGQRGPAQNMTILATAYSARGGTGAHEPMMWVIPFGQGRVFTTVLGHGDYSMKCVGFITTLLRGTEWAATGDVAQSLPDDFPSPDEVSARY